MDLKNLGGLDSIADKINIGAVDTKIKTPSGEGVVRMRTAMSKPGANAFMIDVNGGANGTRVHLWQFGETNVNQKLKIIPCGKGECNITSVASGKYLCARNGGTANGTEIVSGDKKDTWQIAENDDGSCTVKHAASGKVMDISGAKTANGQAAILHDYHGNNNQKFIIDEV